MASAVSRRRFLAATAVLVAGGAVGGGLAAERRLARRTGDRLQALLDGAKAVEQVGEAYLKLVPAEADRGKLADRLIDDLGFSARFASPAELGRRVAERVHDDFVHDRVVAVRGWFLARTEARLCALVHLGKAAAGKA